LLLLAGKKHPPQHAIRQAQYEVHGCESQTWLKHEVVDKRIIIHADSDAKFIRGILVLIIELITQQAMSVDQVKATLVELGFEKNLSVSRSNGVHAILTQLASL